MLGGAFLDAKKHSSKAFTKTRTIEMAELPPGPLVGLGPLMYPLHAQTSHPLFLLSQLMQVNRHAFHDSVCVLPTSGS